MPIRSGWNEAGPARSCNRSPGTAGGLPARPASSQPGRYPAEKMAGVSNVRERPPAWAIRSSQPGGGDGQMSSGSGCRAARRRPPPRCAKPSPSASPQRARSRSPPAAGQRLSPAGGSVLRWRPARRGRDLRSGKAVRQRQHGCPDRWPRGCGDPLGAVATSHSRTGACRNAARRGFVPHRHRRCRCPGGRRHGGGLLPAMMAAHRSRLSGLSCLPRLFYPSCPSHLSRSRGSLLPDGKPAGLPTTTTPGRYRACRQRALSTARGGERRGGRLRNRCRMRAARRVRNAPHRHGRSTARRRASAPGSGVRPGFRG